MAAAKNPALGHSMSTQMRNSDESKSGIDNDMVSAKINECVVFGIVLNWRVQGDTI